MTRLSGLLSICASALFLTACDSNEGPVVDPYYVGDATSPNITADASTDAGALALDAASFDGSADAALDASSLDAASGDGSAGDGSAGEPDATVDAFARCVSMLKAKCGYDEKETSCASMLTPKIPLTDGGVWGNTELKGGPYGAYVEWNEGKAFANPVNILENTCSVLASTFGEPPEVTQDVLNLRGADLALYTVFRPACMKDGEKFPVITWGNGTCGQSGGYGALLATVASHGFVVIAANSRFTDGGNKEMLKALDFAKAANEDSTSPLYQRLDLTKIGAMGHSQGGSATRNAASDPRIKAVILWNGGTSAVKPFLAVSGERDTAPHTSVMDMVNAAQGATQPGGWLYYRQVLQTGGRVTGHLTLMEQPERVADPTIAWWKYMLNGDAEAKKMFVGSDCGLCAKTDAYEYTQKNLP